MKPIAIIPARGGSKRIPGKNVKSFCGKPILAYSIEAAVRSNLFDEVLVSTDSTKIAEISRNYGAVVPFMRGEKTAGDYADTTDVLLEVIEEYAKQGKVYEEFCMIYSTAPFVTPEKLKKSYELLHTDNVNNVVTMVPFSFPPQRGMRIENGFLKAYSPDDIDKRSQDLETIYHDCGQIYWGKIAALKENPDVLSNNTVPYIVSELEVQDIDNETDWKLAEMKYKYMQEQYEH
jgi:N-acylneuraminate cytidylyltransferase